LKRVIILIIILIVFNKSSVKGESFGLGIILGEPTGISLKIWQGKETAIDGAIAWSLGKNNSLHLHGDYLFHKFELLKVKKGKLPIYYGFGARIRIQENNDSKLGFRFPLGLNYLFERSPFDIFLEIAPIFNIFPSTDFDLNASFGVRFFFD